MSAPTTPSRPNIIERLRRDGRLADALEDLLGLPIARNKTAAIRCLNHTAHRNGDAHPSMVVEPEAGRVECRACGLSEGLLDLAIRRGLAGNRAAAAEVLERRWFGDSPAQQPHADSASDAPCQPEAPPAAPTDDGSTASATHGPPPSPTSPPTSAGARKRKRDHEQTWRRAREALVPMLQDAQMREVLEYWNVATLQELEVGVAPGYRDLVPALVFPVKTRTGRVVGVKLRALFKPRNGIKSRTLGGARAGVLGRDQLSQKPDATVVICAGEKDLVFGLRAAPQCAWISSAAGEEVGMGPQAASLLRGRDVVILYDKDEAGRRGAQKLARDIGKHASSVRIATIPDDVLSGEPNEKDVTDICTKLRGDAPDTIRRIIAAAVEFEVAADEGPSGTGRREVRVGTSIATVVDATERALLASDDVQLFARSGLLVRIVRTTKKKRRALRRPVGSPVIEVASAPYVREQLDRAADFVQVRQKADGSEETSPILPPTWAVDTLMARGEWELPPLEGIIEAPTLRGDGSVLAEPGYDEATGLLLEPSIPFPEVPQNPTHDEVQAAVRTLAEPFVDFPFVAPSDRAAASSCLLGTVARFAIDGPCPLVAVRAPTPGTGKTLVVDIVSLVATGRVASRMTVGRDNSETRKLILSIGLEGAPIVLIDNVDGMLGSPALAAALTSTSIRDRLLGASKLVTVSLAGTSWFATGNGLSFKGDLGRRVLPIDLDAGIEHPEDREGFKHGNVLAYALRERPALVTAALTLLRAYHLAGRPAHGLPRVGSFEAWDDLVRGACVWAGIGDPVGGRQRIREEGDADLDALRDALSAWQAAFSDDAVSVIEVLDAAGNNGPLRGALSALAGRSAEKLDARILGYVLRRVRDRLVGGRRFEWAGRTHGRVRWRVVGVRPSNTPSSAQASAAASDVYMDENGVGPVPRGEAGSCCGG